MKKVNLLFIISIILLLISAFFFSIEYLEEQSEKVDLFYHPIKNEDINTVETILREEGLKKDRDYEITVSPVIAPEFKVKNGKYIHIRTDKLFKALKSILNSGKKFEFINPYIRPDFGGCHINLSERKTNDNYILLNIFLNIEGVKRCAFGYGVGIEPIFEEEAKHGDALVILELEKGFSLDKKQLDSIARLTLGCNMFAGYYHFIPLENITICNSEGKILAGNKKGEKFVKESWFSRVKEKLTDKEVKPEIIRFSSRKVKIAVFFLTLSVIGLFWYLINQRKDAFSC